MAACSDISNNSRRLAGKVALITGGASGIGEATARLFCKHGAKVVIADIQGDKGRSICLDITPSGSATYVHCDVTVESDVEEAVDAAVALHGRLDVVFSNAGVYDPSGLFTPAAASDRSEFDRVMAVNVSGALLVIKHAARVMRPGGSIVCTASVASVVAGATSYAYTCSKHALVGLARSAAVELGRRGVRVNCVSPYALATPMGARVFGLEGEALEEAMEEKGVLKGVRLNAGDVAQAVVFLASDESRFVNGHNLLLDGGFSVCNGSILACAD